MFHQFATKKDAARIDTRSGNVAEKKKKRKKITLKLVINCHVIEATLKSISQAPNLKGSLKAVVFCFVRVL